MNTNSHSPQPLFQTGAPASPVPTVLEFSRKPPNQGISGEITPKPRFDGVSTPRFDAFKGLGQGSNPPSTPVSMPHNLEKVMEQLEAEQAENNRNCLRVINEYFCDPDVVKALRDEIRSSDASNDCQRYAKGIEAMLTAFNAGCAVKTVQLVESVATSALAKTFLRDQVKPVLERHHILKKLEGGTFRWATTEELSTLKPTSDLQESSQIDEESTPKPITKWLATFRHPIRHHRLNKNKKILEKAKADPWLRIQDNEVINLPRPFQDELSEADKKLLRDLAKAEAKEKLQGKLASLNDKDFLRELRETEKATQQQVAAMQADAQSKAAEIIARRQITNTKLMGYVPVIGIFLTFGLVALLINAANNDMSTRQDIGNPTYTRIEQARMDSSNQGYQLTVEEAEQQLMQMDAALGQNEAPVVNTEESK